MLCSLRKVDLNHIYYFKSELYVFEKQHNPLFLHPNWASYCYGVVGLGMLIKGVVVHGVMVALEGVFV